MIRLRKALDRHRPAFVLAALLLAATLLPGGPFAVRARLAGLLAPLAALLPTGLPAGPAGGDGGPREEVARLQVRIHELEAENGSLREFRALRLEEKVAGVRAVLASVIGRDPAWPVRRSVLLDRGTLDGLRRGDPVLAGRSLAGFVVETGPSWARVQLLDDPAPRADDARVRIGVRVFRTGAARAFEGALVGERRGILRVRMLPAGAVAAGDLVATTAADPSVPAGLLVGRVVSVEEDRRLGTASAEVEPSADLAAIRALVVLVLPGAGPRTAERRPR